MCGSSSQIRSQAASQLSIGPAHMIGVPSTNSTSPVNRTPASGTWANVSPRVCVGPTSIRSTRRSPTVSVWRSENVSVGSVSVMSPNSNGPKA